MSATSDSRDTVLRELSELLDRTIPEWSLSAFRDRQHGGFHERLDARLRPLPVPSKRLLVQCRQIYVLSRAIARGVAGSDEAAASGVEFLLDYLDEENGGWFFSIDPKSREPIDEKKDSYGHAFVVFALSHFAQVTGDSSALELVDQTLEVCLDRLRTPSERGFYESTSRDWSPVAAVRRQNPHMHWLEACLVRNGLPNAESAMALTRELCELCEEKFYDAETKTLREFFSDDWSPDSERGHIVEPGHHFEWAWLLDELCETTDAPTRFLEISRDLHEWATAHGIDGRSGHAVDEVAPDGRVIRGSRRIWPQCERLKSLARRADGRPAELDRVVATFGAFRDDYLRGESGWVEHYAADGSIAVDDRPGSTPYHIAFALEEVERALSGE